MTQTKKKVKISPQRAEVIRKLRGGARVLITRSPDQGTIFGYTSGDHCNQGVVERMIKNKMLVPVEDGLFPGASQCYILSTELEQS